ncbi:hypothetical protein HYW21_09070 [Candidatus Woesearchaeota archaeon]|nr:hypothetical protein [Candidatus Woesearchaeota archaeon]
MHPVYQSLFPPSNRQTCCSDVLSPLQPGTTQVRGNMSDLIAHALVHASQHSPSPTYGNLEASFGSSYVASPQMPYEHNSRGLPLYEPTSSPGSAAYNTVHSRTQHYEPDGQPNYVLVLGNPSSDPAKHNFNSQNHQGRNQDGQPKSTNQPVVYGVILLPIYLDSSSSTIPYTAHRRTVPRLHSPRSRVVQQPASLDDRLEGSFGSGIERLAA